MRISVLTGSILCALVVVGSAYARNERLRLPVKDAMETEDAKAKLSGDVKFFFAGQKTPKALQTLGTFTSNKKTNFANKSDKEGCQHAFLSSMLALQDRAKREGGNAVVDIHSYYDKQVFKSETEYECAAGNIVGGVALRGTVVKL
jgi:hypothetical protein